MHKSNIANVRYISNIRILSRYIRLFTVERVPVAISIRTGYYHDEIYDCPNTTATPRQQLNNADDRTVGVKSVYTKCSHKDA